MFWAAAIWATRTGNWVRVVSGEDHIHTQNSMHYMGEALDFHALDMDGLNDWLVYLGYVTYWQVQGHYFHVHAENPHHVVG